MFNSLPLQIKKESSITVDSNGTVYGTDVQEVFKINMSNFYLSNVLKLNTAPKLDGTIYESAATQVEYLGVYQDYSTFDKLESSRIYCYYINNHSNQKIYSMCKP